MGLGAALGVEAFVSIHMSVFVLWSLSTVISKNNNKKVVKPTDFDSAFLLEEEACMRK
ncbi:MAG: hypothetical protein SOW32_04985 [Agathobacter sp.]|nr:hypothetical protein [Agathobacter sp.]MDY3797340.1 hypothetical protein [Agathobacter sp.]